MPDAPAASSILYQTQTLQDLTRGADGWPRANGLPASQPGDQLRWQPGLIFHSDLGVEYSAYAFRARLAALGITQSMKRPREIGDNAFIESFFHSMKADAIHGRTFDDDRALHQLVSQYIRRCNRSRLHSSLGYRSPIDYEHAA